MRRINLTSQTFGRLYVESFAFMRQHTYWNCVCGCGTKKIVKGFDLRRGHSTSCGCANREAVAKRSTTHGHSRGYKLTPEYSAWQSMLRRCLNPNEKGWKYYGAKSVRVCDRWNPAAGGSFENFLGDLGPKPSPAHSLSRIGDIGDYRPGNVIWGTASHQIRQRRLKKAMGQRTI
jgi:hypothetical protein